MPPADSPMPRVFIGSSSEGGLRLARALQVELEETGACIVRRWTSIFEPSSYAMHALLDTASNVDFAVLVATPDDVTTSRGVDAPSARDNVLLEFGLFAGALGLDRTYILVTDDRMRLPSDVLGLTQLRYRERDDGDMAGALTRTVMQIERQIRRHGVLHRTDRQQDTRHGATSGVGSVDGNVIANLQQEIELICMNASAQGWKVQKNSPSTLRLRKGRRTLTLVKRSRPEHTREEVRRFAAVLRAAGVRVNSSLRRPVDS